MAEPRFEPGTCSWEAVFFPLSTRLLRSLRRQGLLCNQVVATGIKNRFLQKTSMTQNFSYLTVLLLFLIKTEKSNWFHPNKRMYSFKIKPDMGRTEKAQLKQLQHFWARGWSSVVEYLIKMHKSSGFKLKTLERKKKRCLLPFPAPFSGRYQEQLEKQRWLLGQGQLSTKAKGPAIWSPRPKGTNYLSAKEIWQQPQ